RGGTGRGAVGRRGGDGDHGEVPARQALRGGAGAQAARRAPAGCPGRPGARPQRRGPGRRPGRARPRISRCGRDMTDAPRDAAGAAPEFDSIRPDTAAGTSGQGPDTGNPADRSPRGGAAAGLARLRAVAAGRTRPGRAAAGAAQEPEAPGAEPASAGPGPASPSPELASPSPEPDRGPAPDLEPVITGTARDPGLAGAAPALEP